VKEPAVTGRSTWTLAFILALAAFASGAGCTRDGGGGAGTKPPARAGTGGLEAALDRFEAARLPAAADSARVRRWADSLEARGDSLENADPSRAAAFFRRSRRAYRALADSGGVADVTDDLGIALRNQGRYEDALARYNEALSIKRAIGDRRGVASTLTRVGVVRKNQGRYDRALARYREALSIARTVGYRAGVAWALNDIGTIRRNQGRLDAARSRYSEALEIFRALDSRRGTGHALSNLGIVHKTRGQYDRALKHYRQALDARRGTGDRRSVARTLNNMGNVYRNQGRYDRALARLNEALEIKRAIGNDGSVARTLVNIGNIHAVQGQYSQALARYRKALPVYREVGDRGGLASVLNNFGFVYRNQGRYDRALERFRQTLEIQREIGDREGVADALDDLGIVQRHRSRPDRALQHFREALDIQERLGDREGVARTLSNIAGLRRQQGRVDRALARSRRALALYRQIDDDPGAAGELVGIGKAHLLNGAPGPAADTLSRAVRYAERFRRQTTSLEARRSLLSTEVDAYWALTTAHLRAGRPALALRSAERARTRLLADRLAGTARPDTAYRVPPPTVLQRTLASGEAALVYAKTLGGLSALVVKPDTIVARELADSTFRARLGRAYRAALDSVRRTAGPLRSAFGTRREGGDGPAARAPTFGEAVRLYRRQVTHARRKGRQRDLAHRFYDLLVAPVEPAIGGADEVVVVPGGALGFLPFEMLRDSAGRYLVEKWRVRYTQSLSVLHQLQRRSYAGRERPLLAVGGAAYEATRRRGPVLTARPPRGKAPVSGAGQAAALRRAARQRAEDGKSPGASYADLGYGRWAPLPGTTREVRKLGALAGPGATTITGPGASEARLRRMSRTGALDAYRRVHFATHGVAVPEAPSLSALVLAQVGASDRLAARDGYLSMNEIAGLDLRADVAVLSACRTGFGQLVEGEGVVSLSHAFLRAGANATLVSQWKVIDRSTRRFMTAVYRRADAKGVSFADAVAQAKRAFAAGEYGPRNADPLRWAPFVYYGRE
jgi:tetratricopeptide (TPR) repeat protein/CHAT domain-containing protein